MLFVASSTGLSAIGTLITSVYRFSWSVVLSDLTPQICVEPAKLVRYYTKCLHSRFVLPPPYSNDTTVTVTKLLPSVNKGLINEHLELVSNWVVSRRTELGQQ